MGREEEGLLGLGCLPDNDGIFDTDDDNAELLEENVFVLCSAIARGLLRLRLPELFFKFCSFLPFLRGGTDDKGNAHVA